MSDYRALVPVAPPPAPPRATSRMFPLTLVIDGADIVATRSRRLYVIRGLLGIVLLPLLFALLFVLVVLGLEADEELVGTFFLVFVAIGVLWGIALIALSKWLSLRRTVRFDRTRGVVTRGAVSLPFEGLELRARKLEGISGWTTLEAWHGQRVITIHDRFQSMHAADVATQANYLAQLIGAPLQATPDAAFGAARKHLIPDNTAAMLCYLPFQGIHFIASIYYLFAARERPFVRFAAKQSLTQLAFTLVALIVFGAGFGVPLAIVMQGEKELTPVAIVLLVLLSVSLGVVAFGNIIAHIVACIRAQSGKLWVMPWLKWILEPPAIPTAPSAAVDRSRAVP